MSTNRHSNEDGYPPKIMDGITHEAYLKRSRKAISAKLKAAKAKLAVVERDLQQLYVRYGPLAVEYDVPALPAQDGTLIPADFDEHRRRFNAFLGAEVACYITSAGLLMLLTYLNFNFPLEWQLVIVASSFLIIWKLLPALLEAAFNVTIDKPASIKPIKRTLLVGGVLALGGLIAFSLTRASDEAVGFTAMVYQNSLTVAELGFGLCAASLSILKKFYGWPRTATKKFEKYVKTADDLRAEIDDLSSRLSTYSSGLIRPSEESDENHVN